MNARLIYNYGAQGRPFAIPKSSLGNEKPQGAGLQSGMEQRVRNNGVQGSGWGVLAWEPLGRRLIVEQVYDHHGNVGQGSTPLLVFDAWEHAYYLQYRNVRPDRAAAGEALSAARRTRAR